MTAPLTLRVLPPAPRYGTPFDVGAVGFDEGWWISRWHEGGGPDADAITLSLDGEEIARAMVLHDGPEAEHVGLVPLTDPVELARIEVAEQHRGRGFGRDAVLAIARHYADRDIWVHGDAAAFYEKTGWTRYERADGDTSIVCRSSSFTPRGMPDRVGRSTTLSTEDHMAESLDPAARLHGLLDYCKNVASQSSRTGGQWANYLGLDEDSVAYIQALAQVTLLPTEVRSAFEGLRAAGATVPFDFLLEPLSEIEEAIFYGVQTQSSQLSGFTGKYTAASVAIVAAASATLKAHAGPPVDATDLLDTVAATADDLSTLLADDDTLEPDVRTLLYTLADGLRRSAQTFKMTAPGASPRSGTCSSVGSRRTPGCNETSAGTRTSLPCSYASCGEQSVPHRSTTRP